MSDDDEKQETRSWPTAFVNVMEGCGCVVIVALFLLLAFSSEIINVIHAVRGR